MADYDNPRPSSQPVGSTDPAVVKDDLITLDKITTSTDTTVTNRKGGVRKTLLGLEVDAQNAFRLGAGDPQGDYVGGVSQYEESNWTFTYSGQQWGLSGDFDLSTLPYLTTEADPNNDSNLSVRGNASQEYVQTEITRGQGESVGGTIFPTDDDVLVDGMTAPTGTTHFRVLTGGKPSLLRVLSKVDGQNTSSGVVSNLNTSSAPYTATIGGVDCWLAIEGLWSKSFVSANAFGMSSLESDNTPMLEAAHLYAKFTNQKVEVLPDEYTFETAWTYIMEGSDSSPIFHLSSNNSGTAIYPRCNFVLNMSVSDWLVINLPQGESEGVVIEGITFTQKDALIQTTNPIELRLDSTAYPRKFLFRECNWLRCKGVIKFTGVNANFVLNYFGPTEFYFCHGFFCPDGITINNSVINLFDFRRCLWHGCYIDHTTSAVNINLYDTHFESCEPAGIIYGDLQTNIGLNNVSAENTGDQSGYGLLHWSGSSSQGASCRVHVSNPLYPFVFQPRELRLGRSTRVSASSKINVSGDGIQIETPETVTPVVSNNATYNQSDNFSYYITPVDQVPRFVGEKIINISSANNTTPIDSSELPSSLRDTMLGNGSGRLINWQDSYTAPSDGFIILTWISKVNSSNIGFQQCDVTIDGNAVGAPTGFRYKRSPNNAGEVLMFPISAGQVLTRAILWLYNIDYQTTANMFFVEGSAVGTLSQYNGGIPRITSDVYEIPDGGSVTVFLTTTANTGFNVRSKMIFDSGALGEYSFSARGNGSNATRVLYAVVDDKDANITVADAGSPLNTDMYRKVVTNNTGSTIKLLVRSEFNM